MAIKAGQIIHVGDGTVVIDRIQTAGPTQVNVPKETIYELGNYQSVGQVFDTPDLSFSLESYDVSCEIEALMLGVTTADGPFNPSANVPLDVASKFTAGQNATDPFAVIGSVALPYLTMESLSYRFGLRDDARQTVGLRGDAIYYNPGTTYVETNAGPLDALDDSTVTANAAYAVTEAGVTRRILGVSLTNGKRLFLGVDYTEAYGSITDGAAVTTLTLIDAVPADVSVRIVYSSPVAEDLDQGVHAVVSTSRPAAIRGRDIWVYLGGYDSGTPFVNKMLGVQAVTADWKVTLDKDEEFGNYHVISQDFDVADVSGTIQVKSVDVAAMIELMQKVSGVDPTTFHSANATNVPIIPLDVVLHSPVDGSVLKRISIDDARFTIPGFSGQVQQKLTQTINWSSDKGDMAVSLT